MDYLKKQDIGFTQVRNVVLNDPTLTWKAKGLYAYLYSKPERWQFSADRITAQGATGREAILSGLAELEAVGLLIRHRLKSGRMQYTLRHTKPQTGKPTLAKPYQGKTPPISNTDPDSKTDEREQIAAATPPRPFSLQEVLQKWEQSPLRWLQIVAWFIRAKGLQPGTQAKLDDIKGRFVRTAKRLEKYSDAELAAARKVVQAKWADEWTLETVWKHVTK